MIILKPAIRLLLQEMIVLPTNTDLYHYSPNKSLNDRNNYIFVTKNPVGYFPKVANAFGAGNNEGVVYHFKSLSALQFPAMQDRRLLASVRLYLNTIIADINTPLKQRKKYQEWKDNFEKAFDRKFDMEVSPIVRISWTLTTLATFTDFLGKCNWNGFHETHEKFDNYCVFRWRNKLDIIESITYKNFLRLAHSKC